jgi:hypothetical protein
MTIFRVTYHELHEATFDNERDASAFILDRQCKDLSDFKLEAIAEIEAPIPAPDGRFVWPKTTFKKGEDYA